ncbi:NAD(P)-binding domain-containing protein [Novosphingobium sp.]|uniref:NAD(P)-binding domain-containing protein n=1 Tax=Novosphingobium sp. TaxID=1874826 RepID=UPI0025F9CF3E|nr:NAD(P)-binding domain-containing protein [Novosphingobium sp.]MCC6926815.1 NAD(P)-binding domain-containing protein [Novosphingobium sp.]
MAFDPLLLVYALPLAGIWAVWTFAARRRSAKAREVLEDNRQAGLMEPNSLHPVIDPAKCLGCASCVRACPEKKILGVIDGKAALIEPTMCVGHGACATACPTQAITLVFGTATRGVDIPLLSPEFETSVPGVYIAGELGGMGLIKNAIEQGRQAIAAAAAQARRIAVGDPALDVVIVGCGPAGIAASLGAMEAGLRFVTIDQSSLGGTVAHFPRGKVVMTAPAKLPLIGEVRFGEISKERLLAFWEDVLARTGLKPQFEEQVTQVERTGDLFEVVTSRGRYRTRTVLLAIGRRGTPRPLGVPGEEQSKVLYRLIDPEQYAGQRVLVVGGGDSALEAAAQLADQPGTQVTLSYRGQAFQRARAKNRDRVAALIADGTMTALMGSQVRSIGTEAIELETEQGLLSLPNDSVIVCAGGLLPTQFLHQIGIEVETKFGTV